MAQPLAQTHLDQLKRIKKNVTDAREFFSENYDRFNEFRRFVFSSTLTDDDVTNLQDLQKPILEFNILEPYISRLCGEFSKQEPQIETSANHNIPTPVGVQTVQVVEGIIRDRLDDMRKRGDTYEIFKDLMSGGYSAIETYTEYEPGITFDQNFKLRRVYDPTMIGFDPMARESTKADGHYCFYLYPRYLEDFQTKYPDTKIDDISFIRNSGFSWSYHNQNNRKILLVCDYFEKKTASIKIVKLSDGSSMTSKDYKKLLDFFKDKQILALPPSIVDQRYMQQDTIHRYTFIETEVIEHEETDFTRLPLVFVDGNSILLRQGKEGDIEQITRPYLYHARDIQRLKNFAGQTLANELENMIQHKFKVAEESIPPEYRGAYEDIQHADTLIYKAYSDENPDQPLPPPQEIMRAPIPPEVTNTFTTCDQMTQNILGSFDIQMGNLNKSQLSGLAIQESVTQGNAVAMPYVVGYLQALTQVANVIVDLIPKYYKTPRTVPIMGQDGKRNYVPVNQQQGISLDYPDNALQVSVEAGVNFTVQKTRALQQIISMMQASPLFAQFMNAEGLPILLDNLEIRGIDQLKLLADGFVKQMKAKQAQQAQQPNPLVMKEQNAAKLLQLKQQDLQLKGQEIQNKQQESQADIQLRTSDTMNDANANANDRLKIMLEAHQAGADDAVEFKKAQAEEYSKSVDLALQANDQAHKHTLDWHDQLHQHAKDTFKLANETASVQNQINQSNKPQANEIKNV